MNRTKLGIALIAAAMVLLAAGTYIGWILAQREQNHAEARDALLRTALNLEVIRAVKEGKSDEAMGIVGSMNEINLVYLMNHEKNGPTDDEFVQGKKRVLAKLADDRAARKDRTKTVDAERERFERDAASYLERNR